MQALGHEFTFDAEERRIRCSPHFLHLTVRSMLYGNKKDNFEELIEDWNASTNGEEPLDDAINMSLIHDSVDSYSEIEDDIMAQEDFPSYLIPDQINAEEISKYRKFGPLGKLHNIGVILRTSSQVQEEYFRAQKEVDPASNALSWIHNVCTRWQSDEAMMERALQKRQALNRMLQNIEDNWTSGGAKTAEKPRILDERLSHQEWHVVGAFHKILQPFKIASKQLQGKGISGERSTSGGFDEYFPVVEMLLDHLETAVKGTIYEEDDDKHLVEVDLFDGMDNQTRRLLQAYIKLGWKKLDKYYGLLGSSAYVGAVVFHPCKKWSSLDCLWGQLPHRQATSWKDSYGAKIRTIWEDQYMDRDMLDEPSNLSNYADEGLSYIERRLALRSFPTTQQLPATPQGSRGKQAQQIVTVQQDELTQYLSEPPVNNIVFRNDPIAWWRDVGAGRFPRLSYMAVDFLTIASSSAETERDFSSVGRMITPLRSRLKRSFIAKAQCLRSWSKIGVYKPSLQLNSLQNDNWRDVVSMLAQENLDRH